MNRNKKKRSTNKNYLTWICPECGEKIKQSIADLAEVGSPMCVDCDCEMDRED